MTIRVLVAYESKYGATKEVAERISDYLKSAGLEVKLDEAGKVREIGENTAVVLGSAIYYGRWRKGAVKFLKRFKAELAEIPVWFFSSGPIGEGDPVEQLDGWQFPPLQQEIADMIGPKDVAVFHGMLDESKLNRIEKKIMESMETPAGDFRDWEMIDAWVSKIAEELGE